MHRKKNAPSSRVKRPYRAPELKIHGDLKALTLLKGQNKQDGTQKPGTRNSGAA